MLFVVFVFSFILIYSFVHSFIHSCVQVNWCSRMYCIYISNYAIKIGEVETNGKVLK